MTHPAGVVCQLAFVHNKPPQKTPDTVIPHAHESVVARLICCSGRAWLMLAALAQRGWASGMAWLTPVAAGWGDGVMRVCVTHHPVGLP